MERQSGGTDEEIAERMDARTERIRVKRLADAAYRAGFQKVKEAGGNVDAYHEEAGEAFGDEALQKAKEQGRNMDAFIKEIQDKLTSLAFSH